MKTEEHCFSVFFLSGKEEPLAGVPSKSPMLYERILAAVERYGYGLSLAAAILWFARVDVLIPMVEAHRDMLRSISTAYERLSDANDDRLRELTEIRRILEVIREESHH